MTVSDGAIVAALREHAGRVRDAARSLGVTTTAIYVRLGADPALWPADLPPRARRLRKMSDAQIVDALREAQGIVQRAAVLLCVTPAAISQRLHADPSLWPDGVPRPAARDTSAKGVTDAQIVAALREGGGSVYAAAQALGVSRQTIYARLAANPSLRDRSA